MSKTLDDILGTADTNVPEEPAAQIADESVSPALEETATPGPVVEESAELSATSSDVPAEPETVVEGTTVSDVVEDTFVPAVDVTVEPVKSLECAEEFHPYLKSIIRPVVLYGNKMCTKTIGSFIGTVKVTQEPEGGVALVEYMKIINGARRKMKAYIHI